MFFLVFLIFLSSSVATDCSVTSTFTITTIKVINAQFGDDESDPKVEIGWHYPRFAMTLPEKSTWWFNTSEAENNRNPTWSDDGTWSVSTTYPQGSGGGVSRTRELYVRIYDGEAFPTFDLIDTYYISGWYLDHKCIPPGGNVQYTTDSHQGDKYICNITYTYHCDATPCASRVPDTDGCLSKCDTNVGLASCFQQRNNGSDGNWDLNNFCNSSCSGAHFQGSSGRCYLKNCIDRQAISGQSLPCGPDCYEQVNNGGIGAATGSGIYSGRCGTCNENHFTIDGGKCKRKDCDERKVTSDAFPCASTDCYRQYDVQWDAPLTTCARTCPNGTAANNYGACVVYACQNYEENLTHFCTEKRCLNDPTYQNCCPNGEGRYGDVCEIYCGSEAHSNEENCACTRVQTYQRCCAGCTAENNYVGCNVDVCNGHCLNRRNQDPDCAHYWCKNHPGPVLSNCCDYESPTVNISMTDDCNSFCANNPGLDPCAIHLCSKYEVWFQRDICVCRLNPASPSCSVYCKYPFYNYLKCAEIYRDNSELLCKYLSLSCEEYCKTNQSCLCEYVSFDYCVSTPENVDEYECKYNDGELRIMHCNNYCNRFSGNTDQYNECRCTYINDSTSCRRLCESSSKTAFEKAECKCTTTGLLADGEKAAACMEMCNYVVQDAADVSLTKNLCECYYQNNTEKCAIHCNQYAPNTEDDSNCRCLYLGNALMCRAQCDADFTTDDLTKLLCKCETGDGAACNNYCFNKFLGVGSVEDPKNTRFKNCQCVIAGADGSCESYCSGMYTYGNEEQRKAAEYYCVPWCNGLVNESETNESKLELQRVLKLECFCDSLHRDGDCEVHCEKIITGYAVSADYQGCDRYCQSLIWPDQIAGCLCDYGTEIPLCRSFCVGSNFSTSRCNKYCKNQTNEVNRTLCRCYFDLDLSACTAYCQNQESDSAKLKCLCDLGVKEECAKSCEAFGLENKTMEKARCLCRHHIDKNSCFDYCDLAFAGYDDAHNMQERCKCDYGLGEGYCSRYIATFETKEQLLYECQIRNNTQACHDYCNDFVTVEGNNKETYKCWCEVYGDVNWCPLYCNSLNVSDAELLRCKCLHFADNPSCIQYCATIPRGLAHDECECTLVTPDENSGPTSSQRQACINYCRARPNYMERVRCACDTGLDANRCQEEAAMKIEELQSAKYKERCELNWDGMQHETDCRNYCNLLWIEGGDTTGFQNMLECYCDVVKRRPACKQFCKEKNNNDTESGPYHMCICEHAKYKDSCEKMCDLQFPGDDFKINECNCHATKFGWKEGLTSCVGYCATKYNTSGTGEKGLLYHSCYSGFDKCHYTKYCGNYTDISMQEFCLCHYEPDSTHCTQYCSALAVEHANTTGNLPIADMCRCVWEENNTACRVFCDPDNFADYLCYRSCDTYETTLEYQQCLCTAGASDRACVSVCDEYVGEGDMEGYYECRCTHNLDLLSCLNYCNTLPAEEQETCKQSRVYLGPGTIVGKGIYVDNYDFDDDYVTVNGSSNVTINVTVNGSSNVTNESTADINTSTDSTNQKKSKAAITHENNEKKTAVVQYTAIGVIAACVVVALALMSVVLFMQYRKNSKKRKEAEKEAEVWRKSFQRMSQRMSMSINKQKTASSNSTGSSSSSK